MFIIMHKMANQGKSISVCHTLPFTNIHVHTGIHIVHMPAYQCASKCFDVHVLYDSAHIPWLAQSVLAVEACSHSPHARTAKETQLYSFWWLKNEKCCKCQFFVLLRWQAFDRRRAKCCSGSVVIAPSGIDLLVNSSWRCCGDQLYDSTKNSCLTCSGRQEVMPKTQGCCGAKLFEWVPSTLASLYKYLTPRALLLGCAFLLAVLTGTEQCGKLVVGGGFRGGYLVCLSWLLVWSWGINFHWLDNLLSGEGDWQTGRLW